MQQTAYVASWFIGGSAIPILDLLEIPNKLKMNSYSVKIDTEKVFDSLDHDFIIPASKNFVFKSNLIARIKTFLVEQESCDINGGVTTKHFRLKSCTSGRPYIRISFYFMIRNSVYLEILFIF